MVCEAMLGKASSPPCYSLWVIIGAMLVCRSKQKNRHTQRVKGRNFGVFNYLSASDSARASLQLAREGLTRFCSSGRGGDLPASFQGVCVGKPHMCGCFALKFEMYSTMVCYTGNCGRFKNMFALTFPLRLANHALLELFSLPLFNL